MLPSKCQWTYEDFGYRQSWWYHCSMVIVTTCKLQSRIMNTGFIQDKVQIKCTNYVFTLNSGLSICFLSTFRCRSLNLFLFSQSFTAWFTYAKILLLNLRARSSREYSSVEAIHVYNETTKQSVSTHIGNKIFFFNSRLSEANFHIDFKSFKSV